MRPSRRTTLRMTAAILCAAATMLPGQQLDPNTAMDTSPGVQRRTVLDIRNGYRVALPASCLSPNVKWMSRPAVPVAAPLMENWDAVKTASSRVVGRFCGDNGQDQLYRVDLAIAVLKQPASPNELAASRQKYWRQYAKQAVIDPVDPTASDQAMMCMTWQCGDANEPAWRIAETFVPIQADRCFLIQVLQHDDKDRNVPQDILTGLKAHFQILGEAEIQSQWALARQSGSRFLKQFQQPDMPIDMLHSGQIRWYGVYRDEQQAGYLAVRHDVTGQGRDTTVVSRLRATAVDSGTTAMLLKVLGLSPDMGQKRPEVSMIPAGTVRITVDHHDKPVLQQQSFTACVETLGQGNAGFREQGMRQDDTLSLTRTILPDTTGERTQTTFVVSPENYLSGLFNPLTPPPVTAPDHDERAMAWTHYGNRTIDQTAMMVYPRMHGTYVRWHSAPVGPDIALWIDANGLLTDLRYETLSLRYEDPNALGEPFGQRIQQDRKDLQQAAAADR